MLYTIEYIVILRQYIRMYIKMIVYLHLRSVTINRLFAIALLQINIATFTGETEE